MTSTAVPLVRIGVPTRADCVGTDAWVLYDIIDTGSDEEQAGALLAAKRYRLPKVTASVQLVAVSPQEQKAGAKRGALLRCAERGLRNV
ncbi:MAG: hypothetical protein WBE83_02810 [Candidatus Cybelea sp.]